MREETAWRARATADVPAKPKTRFRRYVGILAVASGLLLAAPGVVAMPAYDPVRGHHWGETGESALQVEAGHEDSSTGIAPQEDLHEITALHYTLSPATPFEFVALLFDNGRLARIMYPLHLPVQSADISKPFTDVPEKFQVVRSWLTEHLGEPDRYTTSEPDAGMHFTNVSALVERDAYAFRYTWCSEKANALLIAVRDQGKAPLLLASVESPQYTTSAGESEARPACPATGK